MGELARELGAGIDRQPTARAERGEGSRPEGYEAPRIDFVLGPDGLERETVYAGTPPTGPAG